MALIPNDPRFKFFIKRNTVHFFILLSLLILLIFSPPLAGIAFVVWLAGTIYWKLG